MAEICFYSSYTLASEVKQEAYNVITYMCVNGSDHVYCNKAQNKLATIENYPE